MKEYKDKLGRIAVLLSQHNASKLCGFPSSRVRHELCELSQGIPFADKRKLVDQLSCDVVRAVQRNLKSPKRRRRLIKLYRV